LLRALDLLHNSHPCLRWFWYMVILNLTSVGCALMPLSIAWSLLPLSQNACRRRSWCIYQGRQPMTLLPLLLLSKSWCEWTCRESRWRANREWVVCQARLLRDRLGWFTCSDRPKARTSSFWVQILNAPTSSILGRKEYSISDELYKSILEYLGTCCVAARVGNLETTGGLHLHIVHFLAEANTLVILRCCYPYPLYLALH
jgi:hypothetical protein